MLALTPLLVPLATALLCVLTQAQPRWQQRVSLAGAFLLLGCALALLQQVQQYGAVNVAAGNSVSGAAPLGSGHSPAAAPKG